MLPSIRSSLTRRLLCPSVLFAAFVIIGCQAKPTSTVSGKVTYKNEPLTSGTVNFIMSEKGISAQGTIDSSGAYKLEGEIQPGTYKVYILPPLPEQLPPGKVSKQKPFNVPPKYQDAGTTTITKEVKEGINDIPIEIPN